jgi:hypothetical protein
MFKSVRAIAFAFAIWICDLKLESGSGFEFWIWIWIWIWMDADAGLTQPCGAVFQKNEGEQNIIKEHGHEGYYHVIN